MSDTLRDQLLGLGFKPVPKPDKPVRSEKGRVAEPAARAPRPGRPQPNRPQSHKPAGGRPPHARPAQGHPGGAQGKPRSQQEIDLAKAYAIRAQKEKDERIEAERLKQEEARKRREAKAKLAELLKDKALNDPAAEIARHFDYGGKIKRIYVSAAQLKSLNAGELGVVQLDGRYLLVTAALLAEAESIFSPAVALKVDPDAPAADDPYADPQYQVPDDLVW
ncbi:uncharacterized protein YaiL (DUF2058 family) [Luteimonas cucumeris]|uniref:Uncharacterized protein YaiL (DUF2058 family) n=1 Tax=Luteimonas cucumeris TaxID=985012 RepID=A0A562L8F0_9GAMM|nr:DUF2058 family protein [Luteimonas cucumeris]TWI03744.1 uncharacterized protein YaiL (DUF2058 family) [Luteimonas cucumeris]